jgi:predicted SPOUT superfamily RNA methylase MTH1
LAKKSNSFPTTFFSSQNLIKQQFSPTNRYLETPQYLRKVLYPMHPDLKYAGLQNPLDAPHHLRKGEVVPYREGTILEKKWWPDGQWTGESYWERQGNIKLKMRATVHNRL